MKKLLLYGLGLSFSLAVATASYAGNGKTDGTKQCTTACKDKKACKGKCCDKKCCHKNATKSN